ncbi:MAG: GNAT family N-acetyltransferase [Desulfosporosinus sp.]|nr:GNAT family N-acetyltransferase [Desulfosporosinus sp.]
MSIKVSAHSKPIITLCSFICTIFVALYKVLTSANLATSYNNFVGYRKLALRLEMEHMGIRNAKEDDWKRIKELLEQLGYSDTDSFLKAKILTLLGNPDEELLVYELGTEVVAVMSLHFIPQLALEGDFARISYFAVDGKMRSRGVGREIEEYCIQLAKDRKCDRVEVHCNSRRTDAHRFYFRQGFTESPKYLIKMLF